MADHAGLWGPEVMEDSSRTLLRNHPFSVFLPGTTTLIPLYTDRTKATPAANPSSTDALGNAYFYADPGVYDLFCNGLTLDVVVELDPEDAVGPQGDQGIQGEQGDPGLDGADGADGAPGAKWYSGAGAPANGTGIIGDWYVNLTNYDIYEKTGASAWTLRGNLKGAQGIQGIQGEQGIQGLKGDKGDTGDTGPPGGGLATVSTTDSASIDFSGNGTAGTPLTGTVIFGTSGTTAAAGNDARLSDTRTPTDASVTPAKFHSTAIDPAAGVAGARTLGTGANQALPGNSVRKLVIPHTWAISGEVKVPSGDTDFIMPMFVPVPATQTVKLLSVAYRINSGTSATFKLRRAAFDGAMADLTGFTGLVALPGDDVLTDPADITFANLDRLRPEVTAVSGTPKNLTITVFLEYTLA